MVDILMYNPNDDTQNFAFCLLQLVVETFWHSTWWTKFNESPQICLANEKEKVIIERRSIYHPLSYP